MPPTGPPVRRAAFAELDPVTAYLIWRLRAEVFVVEQDDEPVAYVRVLDDDECARIGRVVTDARHRGRGLAAALMAAALTELEGRDVELNAQSHLRSWYEGFGFTVAGDEFLDDGIPHLPMLRAVP